MYVKLKSFNFRHFWQPSWIFAENEKNVSISNTVRERAISIEFLIHRVIEEYSMSNWKISIFSAFGGHLGFLRKTKWNVNISETVRDSDFDWIFESQCSSRIFYAKLKNFNFRHFWWPSWILWEKQKNVNISETIRDERFRLNFWPAG